jgi:hypothetical protein
MSSPMTRCRSDDPPPTPRSCATAYPPAAVAGLLPHAPAHHHHRATGDLRQLQWLLWLVLALQLSTVLLVLAGPVPAPLAATPDDPVPMRRQRIHWHPAVVTLLRQEA